MIKDGDFAGLAKTLAEMGVQTVEMCSPFGYSDFASLSDGREVRKVSLITASRVRALTSA